MGCFGFLPYRAAPAHYEIVSDASVHKWLAEVERLHPLYVTVVAMLEFLTRVQHLQIYLYSIPHSVP